MQQDIDDTGMMYALAVNRTAHALNRGAGLEGYVVCAQSSPQQMGNHMEILESLNYATEVGYWKNIYNNEGN